ncbi:MAG: hypothetical protein INR73_18055 [Williamsia sp.]|nr:hypothetical protein [Williamsia sp.]
MIKEFDFYHGVVFSRLIHESKTPLYIACFTTSSNASYVLNDKVGLYIKHSTKRMSPWRFSMLKKHQAEIEKMKLSMDDVFILLVCGEDGVVCLNYEELKIILNDCLDEVEWISAARVPNKEYSVKGSDGTLGHKIGKNSFPRNILNKCKIEVR